VFPGPIRVFVEDVLRSPLFGAAGFVHSIAWAQFRPEDGQQFQKSHAFLDRRASRLLPFVREGMALRGARKMLYKFNRSRVPRAPLRPEVWAALLEP
jgi:hypothetical protein